MSNRFYDHTTFPTENSLASSSGMRAELDLIEAGFTGVAAEIDGKAASNHTHGAATTAANGFMSAADKTKLNGIAAGANVYSHPGGDGNLHVPATGTGNNGRVLKAGATAGSLSWGTLSAGDVGAAAANHTHDYVPTSRTINGKALNANVTLSAGDVGASATGHTHAYLPLAGGTLTGALVGAGISGNELGVRNIANNTGKGVSLYGSAQAGMPQYGMAFSGTATFGTHGAVNGDWATYFTVAGAPTMRGWIFKNGNGSGGNVASLSLSGVFTTTRFDGALNGNAASATVLQTARTINGVAFNGSSNITVTAAANGGTSAACSGNAATATKLATARTINGVAFDGSSNITIPAAPVAPGTLSGTAINWATNTKWHATVSSNTTFSFSANPLVIGTVCMLRVHHTGGTIAWPATVEWPLNATPDLRTGRVHLFLFYWDGSKYRASVLRNYRA